MQAPTNINPAEFQRALTPQVVFSFQVIHGGVIASAIMFAAAVFYVASTTPSPSDFESLAKLDLLSMMHVLMATACYLLAKVVFDRQFRTDHESPSISTGAAALPAEAAADGIRFLRKAIIIRLALMEAPAFFGLTICLVAALNGVLHEHPRYWANAWPAIILIVFIITTFPTSDRLMATFDERMRAL